MNIPRRVITYMLHDASGTSDGCYRTIVTFADQMLAQMEPVLGSAIADYLELLGLATVAVRE
jgi:hypothetical protein